MILKSGSRGSDILSPGLCSCVWQVMVLRQRLPVSRSVLVRLEKRGLAKTASFARIDSQISVSRKQRPSPGCMGSVYYSGGNLALRIILVCYPDVRSRFSQTRSRIAESELISSETLSPAILFVLPFAYVLHLTGDRNGREIDHHLWNPESRCRLSRLECLFWPVRVRSR